MTKPTRSAHLQPYRYDKLTRYWLRPVSRFILCLLLFSASPSPLFAQESTSLWARPNLVKSNLLAPLSIFYERALSRRFALQASARWLRYVQRNPIHFVNVALEGRFYLGPEAWLQTKVHPAGFYVSPYLKARSLTYINEVGYGFTKVGDRDEIIVKSFGYGVVVGYQWVDRKNLTIDVFLGGGSLPPGLSSYQHTMRYSSVISTNGFYSYQFDCRAGVSLGYAF